MTTTTTALRDASTSRVRSFRACALSPRIDQVELVRVDADWGSSERLDGACPTHGDTACVDTFIARSRLASMSLRELWRQWRAWRREEER